MKCVFSRIIAAFFIIGTLGACSPDLTSTQGNENLRILAPMNSSAGAYSLSVVELLGVEDLQTLAGRFARFFMSPRIVEGRLDGQAPKTRFIRNTKGEYIPGNEMTQQLVTVYAHMQRLALLDEELGAGGVNTWPRDVGVAVRVKDGVKNNAFYDGATDSMLFVPYVQSQLPIAVNGGILAHEHFHSLFYKLVLPDSQFKGSVHDREDFLENMEMLGDSSRRKRADVLSEEQDMNLDEGSLHFYYHLAMVRALNEGLADFWGWMYTGDPDFIAQSLPSEKASRSLQVQEQQSVAVPTPEALLRSIKLFYNVGSRVKMRDYTIGYAYKMATQYSRFLKRFTDLYAKEKGLESLQARKEIAKAIIKTLPKIKMDFDGIGNDFYTSQKFIESFGESLGDLSANECQFLVAVMRDAAEVSREKFTCNNGKMVREVQDEADAKKNSQGGNQ